MKLRLRHNSIRLRLGISEVLRLRESGECREAIQFPGDSRLEYVLAASGSSSIDVSFADGVVSVGIPSAELAAWQSSDQIGICAEIGVRHGKTLQVLIEKDFRCLDERDEEDQSDTFENPLSAHVSC